MNLHVINVIDLIF